MSNDNILLKVQDLKKHFPITQGIIFMKEIGSVKAVDGISFDIKRGETLASVAEKFYGDRNAWMVIYKANRSAIPNKDRLLVGTVLTIPPRGSR